MKIPPGVHPGQYIRLAGQGMPGHGGEPAGDLYLEVRIAPHKLYRIEGRDLYMTLPVTPTEAALGAQVQVPTPGGGVVEVTVPRNARNGLKLRLKERGLPGKPPGHLYLLLEIALPPADSDAARKAYEQLARPPPSTRAATWECEHGHYFRHTATAISVTPLAPDELAHACGAEIVGRAAGRGRHHRAPAGDAARRWRFTAPTCNARSPCAGSSATSASGSTPRR